MISSTSSGDAPRIPSWKRLGLKLKSAQTSQDQNLRVPIPDSPRVIESSNKKRQRDIEEDLSIKKLTTSDSGSKSEPLRPITINPNTPKSNRKKSVTFTPETKSKDGDSIKQLYLTWVADQKAQDDFFNTPATEVFRTPVPHKVEENFDNTLPESERRVKRVKKSEIESNLHNGDKTKESTSKKSVKKSKKAKKTKETKSTASRPFLAYLRQYCESRETWKFNKNHQNHLIKHAFDIDIVPSDHIHLLYSYIRGLQGGVRTRLRKAALATKVKDQEDRVSGFTATMADSNKRQKEYDVAMNEYVATVTAAGASSHLGYEEGVLMGLSDAAMRGRMAKRMRAEQVLAELGSSSSEETTDIQATETESVATDGEKRLRLNDGSAQKLGRRRKRRTLAEVDETSSSSSDSSSDSDDSSEDDSTPNDANDDSTSSSSSSSSESDSDDDESSSEGDSTSSDSDDGEGIA